MAEWLGRDLSELDLVVLMIDGVFIEEHVLLVALGIASDGQKHVLGVREGATENAASCTALLADLRDRGMHTDRARGDRRLEGPGDGNPRRVRWSCTDPALPGTQGTQRPRPASRGHAPVGASGAARRVRVRGREPRAKRLLANLVRRLRDAHPGAAASLEEGLDETLTVKRLSLPSKLERQLSTTNAIENVMGAVRRLTRRVKRWRGGRMIPRWILSRKIVRFSYKDSRGRARSGDLAPFVILLYRQGLYVVGARVGEGHASERARRVRGRAVPRS